MDSLKSIVLQDNEILAELFGPNDRNLKHLESLINFPIFYRGNELTVQTGNVDDFILLKNIFTDLEEHVKKGHLPTIELLESIVKSYSTGDSKNSEKLKNTSISIRSGYGTVFPKTGNQAHYMEVLAQRDMIFAIGPAGTGKTYIAIAKALQEVLAKDRKKLVLTRPVVEAGENLGFLPGDLAQKINPYLRPLYDAIDSLVPLELRQKLEESGVIEIAPLAYMRGRSLNDSFIILDEAQNTTKEQMKMFLTRLGNNSKAIITGDITQIDLQKKGASGLLHAKRILGHIEDIGFVYLKRSDIVRNRLVKQIILAYENEK